VRGARLIGDEDVLVNSIAEVEGEEPVEANWRLRSDNGELLIVDVIVEGVSLAVSQRSQFDSVIQDQGFSGLVERLQDAAKGDGEADSLISDGPFTTTDGESG
jgi:phospholipid transport system substrate-binding protein